MTQPQQSPNPVSEASENSVVFLYKTPETVSAEMKAIYYEQAQIDKQLIAHQISTTNGNVIDLFVQSLRIQDFLDGKPQPQDLYDAFDCMVCKKVDKAQWRREGLFNYSRTHLHCINHAEEFHQEVSHRYICCARAYHPNTFYEWRNIVRNQAPIAQPVQRFIFQGPREIEEPPEIEHQVSPENSETKSKTFTFSPVLPLDDDDWA